MFRFNFMFVKSRAVPPIFCLKKLRWELLRKASSSKVALAIIFVIDCTFKQNIRGTVRGFKDKQLNTPYKCSYIRIIISGIICAAKILSCFTFQPRGCYFRIPSDLFPQNEGEGNLWKMHVRSRRTFFPAELMTITAHVSLWEHSLPFPS